MAACMIVENLLCMMLAYRPGRLMCLCYLGSWHAEDGRPVAVANSATNLNGASVQCIAPTILRRLATVQCPAAQVPRVTCAIQVRAIKRLRIIQLSNLGIIIQRGKSCD